MFKFKADLTDWQKNKKTYTRNDGLAQIEHKGNRWIPSTRESIDQPWTESKFCYGSLHAAQSEINRQKDQT